MAWSADIFNNLPLALNCTLGSMLIIILILVTYFRMYSIDHFLRNIFCSLLVFLLAAIISDLAFLLFDGIPGRLANSFRYLFSVLHYLFQTLSCYYIMILIDYMAFKRKYRSGKIIRIACIVIIIYALIHLFSYIVEVFFHIDLVNNFFYRESHFYFRLVAGYSPLLFVLGKIFLFRSAFKRSQATMFFILLTFFILGSAFDFLFIEARLVWPLETAALLYIYFFIVQSFMFIDPLTETGNRLSFNEFIDRLSRFPTGESWAIVMIDMDHFKQINDTLGHQEGDNALGYMAEIIKSCISKDDFAIRYGGDEFVLATKVEKDTAESVIAKLMNEIQILINIFNEREICPFKLEISYGYDVYTADGKQSMEEFLSHIDSLMYKNKYERHRRSSDRKQEEVR